MIKRKVGNRRILEVINTMPNPVVQYIKVTVGIPTIKVKAINAGGVCVYTTSYGGSLGMKVFENTLIDLGGVEVDSFNDK